VDVTAKQRVNARCRTCVYFKHRARPDLKVPCYKVKKRPNFRACHRYRPLVCVECLHFVLRTCRVRRHPRPYDQGCNDFIDRNSLQVKGQLPSLDDEHIEQFLTEGFREILNKVFAIEKAAYQALNEIQEELRKQGVVVPFDQSAYNRIVSLVTRVYMLNQVAQLSGVGHLRDEILEYDLYGRQREMLPAAPPSPPVKRGPREPR